MGALLLPVALTLARWGGSCRPVRIVSVKLSMQIQKNARPERENKIKKKYVCDQSYHSSALLGDVFMAKKS